MTMNKIKRIEPVEMVNYNSSKSKDNCNFYDSKKEFSKILKKELDRKRKK